MKSMRFEMPDDNDPMYRAYRKYVWENDALGQEPIPAGKKILILPWDRPRVDNDESIILYVDSRYAFGDGRHPTTTLCLALLEEYLAGLTPSEKKGLNMLDMGTGTGILSMENAYLQRYKQNQCSGLSFAYRSRMGICSSGWPSNGFVSLGWQLC